MDYAQSQEFPITIVTGSGTFSNETEQFESSADFMNAVLTSAGARDLQRSDNTVPAPMNNLNAGDLLLVRNNGVTANHVQMVTSVTSAEYGVHQGNSGILNGVPGASRLLGASNPRSISYTGVAIQRGTYDRSDTSWTRDGAKSLNYGTEHNLQSRSWNFSAWNR